jgi:hypothetical protein
MRLHSALANKTPDEFRAQHIVVAASAGNSQNFHVLASAAAHTGKGV